MTPWTVACHDPLSLGFFRQEYWSELPFPPPGDLPDSGIEHTTPACLLPCRWIHYHWIMWAFPDQGSNLGPLLLNHWILTTGPLRNSPSFPFNTKSDTINIFWQGKALCKRPICPVTNLKPVTSMLYSPSALTHVLDLLGTQHLA